MTAGLLIAGVIIFAMVVAGVWLMQYAEAEPAARAVGRAPDPAEEQEARESLSQLHGRASSSSARQKTEFAHNLDDSIVLTPLAERPERQAAVDRSRCSRLTSRRSPVRAGHRPSSRARLEAEPRPSHRRTTSRNGAVEALWKRGAARRSRGGVSAPRGVPPRPASPSPSGWATPLYRARMPWCRGDHAMRSLPRRRFIGVEECCLTRKRHRSSGNRRLLPRMETSSPC